MPFIVTDLPGYLGSMFDHLIAHPEHMRLTAWAQLERPAVSNQEITAYRLKTDAITGHARTASFPLVPNG